MVYRTTIGGSVVANADSSVVALAVVEAGFDVASFEVNHAPGLSNLTGGTDDTVTVMNHDPSPLILTG